MRAPREIRELDLAEDYPQIIRKGRKKHGLSQEDLAMKVKERLSIIQKMELGKMVPNMRLAKTLEHVLRIKLLVPSNEPPPPKATSGGGKEVTLADIAVIRERGEEATEDES
jgi:putative transcription factor